MSDYRGRQSDLEHSASSIPTSDEADALSTAQENNGKSTVFFDGADSFENAFANYVDDQFITLVPKNKQGWGQATFGGAVGAKGEFFLKTTDNLSDDDVINIKVNNLVNAFLNRESYVIGVHPNGGSEVKVSLFGRETIGKAISGIQRATPEVLAALNKDGRMNDLINTRKTASRCK